jgi:serpin B
MLAPPPVTVRTVAPALKTLGLDLLAGLPADANAVISPYSLAAALDLIAIGGDDKMRATLSAATGLSAGGSGKHASLASLDARLAAASQAAGVSMELANAVWLDQSEQFADGYPAMLKSSAGVEPGRLDLSDTEATGTINAWVKAATHDHIADILSAPPGPAAFTVGNALFFHGDWSHPFNPASTEKKPFHVRGAPPVDVDLMLLSANLPYREDADFQAVELPYGHTDLDHGWFSLILLLPKNELADPVALVQSAGARVEAALNGTGFDMRAGTVMLPRQKLEGRLDPIAALHDFDIVAAISAPGGLSRMLRAAPARPRYTSVQRTILDIDEKGTTAAAASVVTMSRSLAAGPSPKPPFVFRADRPFIFCLREATTGTVLMLGVVRRPGG